MDILIIESDSENKLASVKTNSTENVKFYVETIWFNKKLFVSKLELIRNTWPGSNRSINYYNDYTVASWKNCDGIYKLENITTIEEFEKILRE